MVLGLRGGAMAAALAGEHNWFSGGFEKLEGWRLDERTNRFERLADLFADPAGGDFRLKSGSVRRATAPLPPSELELPPVPGRPMSEMDPPLTWQYRHPAGREKRIEQGGFSTVGAHSPKAKTPE